MRQSIPHALPHTLRQHIANDSLASFGAALRSFRRQAGLGQEELAERAGVSAYTISNLERGVARAPHKDTVQLLARALELTPEEMVVFMAAAPTPLRRPTALLVSPVPAARRLAPS